MSKYLCQEKFTYSHWAMEKYSSRDVVKHWINIKVFWTIYTWDIQTCCIHGPKLAPCIYIANKQQLFSVTHYSVLLFLAHESIFKVLKLCMFKKSLFKLYNFIHGNFYRYCLKWRSLWSSTKCLIFSALFVKCPYTIRASLCLHFYIYFLFLF